MRSKISNAIWALVKSGQKQEAINRYQAMHNVSEETARSFVEILEMSLAPAVARSSESRRGISSLVKREVWKRDEGSCAECGSKEKLV
jgi:hypothetical protein